MLSYHEPFICSHPGFIVHTHSMVHSFSVSRRTFPLPPKAQTTLHPFIPALGLTAHVTDTGSAEPSAGSVFPDAVSRSGFLCVTDEPGTLCSHCALDRCSLHIHSNVCVVEHALSPDSWRGRYVVPRELPASLARCQDLARPRPCQTLPHQDCIITQRAAAWDAGSMRVSPACS